MYVIYNKQWFITKAGNTHVPNGSYIFERKLLILVFKNKFFIFTTTVLII